MSSETLPTHEANNAKIDEMIRDIRVAMLTTLDPDGQLHSRPMGNLERTFDGSLWFFSSRSSAKIHCIETDSHVNVAYSQPSHQCYVSLAGKATLTDDRAQKEELWRPFMKAWFPKGLEDPDLTLIHIEIESAQYWDSPSSTVVKIVGFTKALLTGKPYLGGENKKVQIQH